MTFEGMSSIYKHMQHRVSMSKTDFDRFFSKDARHHLYEAIAAALEEDGPDYTTLAIFESDKMMKAQLVAKDEAVLAGLPIVPMVLELTSEVLNPKDAAPWKWEPLKEDGEFIEPGDILGRLEGPARLILRAERIILNFISHLSGIATMTARYVKELEGTGVTLLDTRKTLPGLRYPEKYAVRVGGGRNHRCNLSEMLLLKNNHIDAMGGIIPAVEMFRRTYSPCPPIEVECRNIKEVKEALEAGFDRIMLDNMDEKTLNRALLSIPAAVEVEISGGVHFNELRKLALVSERRPDFISVGRLTHSSPSADISLHYFD